MRRILPIILTSILCGCTPKATPPPPPGGTTGASTSSPSQPESMTNNLYLLDLKTGKELWKAPLVLNQDTTDDFVLMAGDHGVVCHNKTLMGFSAKDGKTTWKGVSLGEGHCAGSLGCDGTFVVHNWNGTNSSLICFQLASGKEVWKLEKQATLAGAAQGMAVVISAETVEGLNMTSGKSLWKLKLPQAAAYLCGDQVLCVGSLSNTIQAVDLKSGKPLWNTKVGNGQPIGSLLCLDKDLIVSCDGPGGSIWRLQRTGDARSGATKVVWSLANSDSVNQYGGRIVTRAGDKEPILLIDRGGEQLALKFTDGHESYRLKEATGRDRGVEKDILVRFVDHEKGLGKVIPVEAVDIKTGNTLWQKPAARGASLAIAGDQVVVNGVIAP